MTKHILCAEIAALLNRNPRESAQNLERVIEGMVDNYERDRATPADTLGSISRRQMIIGAHQSFAGNSKVPLWAFVKDICCVGSTSATKICRECGWDPDQETRVKLT